MKLKENKMKNFFTIGIIICFLIILIQNFFKQKSMPSNVIYVDSRNIEEEILKKETNNQSEKININLANENELQKLPGIGKAMATKIVEKRNKNGDFKVLEELKKIKGIGDKKFEKIKDLICI